MESACLVRDHEAQMKELKLARFESQKNLADEIIQQQRALIDGMFKTITDSNFCLQFVL